MELNIVVVIQARMGSTRLPGKVMRMLGDRTVLGHVISRCQAVTAVTEVVVATSDSDKDDVIYEEAINNGVICIRGSEEDVLSRYYEAATVVEADHIIRVTSDCPLLDPGIVESLISYYFDGGFDYARVGLDCFPRGLDAEIFSYEHLECSHKQAVSEFEREHVTQFILKRPDQFRIGIFRNNNSNDQSDALYRLTVDTIEDWTLVSAIYQELYDGQIFCWERVRKFLRENPSLAELNKDVEQKHPTT